MKLDVFETFTCAFFNLTFVWVDYLHIALYHCTQVLLLMYVNQLLCKNMVHILEKKKTESLSRYFVYMDAGIYMYKSSFFDICYYWGDRTPKKWPIKKNWF